MPEAQPRNIVEQFFQTMRGMLEGPVVFVREKIVEPNQQHYPWYHQKFRRVPTIDQCYNDDIVCYTEANFQYKRDKQVENEILSILRHRFEDCMMYEAPDHAEKCKDVLKQYEDATTNWFIKYGDLGAYHNVKMAYMKQKHRMIWERRHGPVGSGMKQEENE
ncbi:PREDICTED: NADH dehydrogenase [ubiquinone] 1 beta subcomplex subunit 10 [Nicrophorus vespilloides]|uniref:NADH dehydrogenase [ubiquinone] 1 beta subcomplex subunit 10 n=1 Tax=Nicrophorus vespilloides TaxID=110193 RepID=A0ABM1MJ52_NICVS|nr:PREDICTED: NADH dehydrogenase [ubiquinone] 1 beta subcomplex subunit 10 [Nicrophorus vespilloides]